MGDALMDRLFIKVFGVNKMRFHVFYKDFV